MQTNADSNGPTQAETTKAGLCLRVAKLDGSAEDVSLAQLPLKRMEALLAAQGDEMQLALLYTGRDESWFDSLEPDGQELIVREGDRLNADFFGRWFLRRQERLERLIPGSRAKLLGAMDPGSPNLASPNSSPVRLVPAG
jgi:hypothetical protein